MADALDETRRHYASQGLYERIVAALRADGKDPDHPGPDDLAGVDEFHTRGRAATVDLARRLSITAEDRVLDLGGGLGGPARYLARTFGTRVAGIDLSPHFCDVANRLSRLAGLEDKVDFKVGNALAIPFPDQHFDVVWSQNVAMNIADRAGLYREIQRVLRPGGRYGFTDMTAVEGKTPLYPQPWADDAGASHLRTPQETRRLIEEAGLRLLSYEDQTADALARSRARLAADTKPGASRVSLSLLFGERWALMQSNSIRNYEEGLYGYHQGVAARPKDAARDTKVV